MDERWRILLIDDDEDEYFLLKELISGQTKGRLLQRYELEWVSTYEEALQAISSCRYDLYLVDYNLGAHSGLDLLRGAADRKCPVPIIMLTGQGDYRTDLAAMQLGAADYLEKGQLTLPLLERSIRYAVERARNLADIQKQAQDIDALQKATLTLLNTLNLSELMSHILETARQTIPAAEESWLHISDAAKGTLRRLTKMEINDPHIRRVAASDPPNPVFTGIREGRTLLVPDVQLEPRLLQLLEREQLTTVRSLMIAPLRIAQGVFGAVSVTSAAPFVFTEDDLRLLGNLAVTASTAVHNCILYAETQDLATHDPLTGKLNRRTLFEYGQREVDRSNRFGHDMSVLMFDVDHFKDVNDTYGHAVGDKVLKTIAERCSRVIRNVDMLARYGGDEFTVLLPEADITTAKEIADRIRHSIKRTPIHTDAGPVSVSISVGVAQADRSITKFSTLLQKADQALYRSKQAGRNSTTLAG